MPCIVGAEPTVLSMGTLSKLSKEQEQEALRIHREAVVVDCLACPIVNRETFEQMIQGGVTACNWTVGGKDERDKRGPEHDFRQIIREIVHWYSLFRENGDKIHPVTTPGDIVEAKKQKKLGVAFGLQFPRPVEYVDDLEPLYRLGLRVFQLTYNERSLIGDGVAEKRDGGLSAFGEKVVHELNRLGIVIDLSHCGRKTALDAIQISKYPCTFSHASASALTKSLRNKSDEELKALAEKGGVVGVTPWGGMIWSKEGQRPTIDDYLNHVDYVVDLVGVDHVGIGMDLGVGSVDRQTWENFKRWYPSYVQSWFTFESFYAEDLNNYIKFPNITRGLVGRGYSEEEIKKILGENILQMFERVWR